ncbi:hypothetical protein [Ruania halotolerans]|uniref:hypothetical protein n=1 Tax=Ruania halotolerans TaxID=2897773 RepID=UPI001E516882|nr:hypothetical protein [Ruania halotolerans]UFU06150.1 hypothetical protein LQF10_17245 [Ruania halotolerans]
MAAETQRNISTDPWVVAAQQHLLAAVCERTAGHPALWGYDVGNERNVLTAWNPADEATVDAWCATMVATITEHAPRDQVVIGVDQRPWISHEPSPSPQLLASTGSMAAAHAWTWLSGALTRFGEQGKPARGRLPRPGGAGVPARRRPACLGAGARRGT